jgi:hypothetical protein
MVTTVSDGKRNEHIAPQLIPAGAELTIPPPEPPFDTLSE